MKEQEAYLRIVNGEQVQHPPFTDPIVKKNIEMLAREGQVIGQGVLLPPGEFVYRLVKPKVVFQAKPIDR